jgi:signal transduction histidine kinase
MSSAPQNQPVLILNVDDYEAGRYVRTRLLLEAGYEVVEAGTGHDALRLAAERTPALILLDIHLPDMSGLEVCRRVKANQNLTDVVVLHLSASATSGPQQVQGLDSGADSYLVEPVDADVLLATVRSLLRVRKAESDLRSANSSLLASNQELARVNSALRASNEDLQRFSYLASHDLQEPLRTIICFSELLTKRYGKQLDAEADDFLASLRDAARRMSMLIRDLLMYAESGQDIRTPSETCDLNDVLHWARENLKQSIDEAGVSFVHGRLPTVQVNPIPCTQLFQNLISNAIKYREPSRPLEIRIEAAPLGDGQCLISFTDNGIGIAPDYHEHIFVPFKRLHGHEVPGTGIGLALCRRIIERHGGRIWVESQGLGHGAKFCLTLPCQAL